MNFKFFLLVGLCWLAFPIFTEAQFNNGTGSPEYALDSSRLLHYNLSAAAVGSSNKEVPFWMRSDQYGSIPLSGASGSLMGSIERPYSLENKQFDWAAGVDGRLNIGSDVKFTFIEAYLKAKLSIFQVKVGRTRDRCGLVDSTLSSGSFIVSGNALGIPAIDISIPDYWNIPFTNSLIAIRGNFVNGFFGKQIVQSANSPIIGEEVETYYHHLSFYGRVGKPNWKINFYGGVNHDVIWGGEKKIFDDYHESFLSTLRYVITGKRYGGATDNISKVGNHLGSLDAGFTYNFSHLTLFAYRQAFYDKGALYYLANIKDGLTGISIANHSKSNRRINKVVVEFFYSKNQAGEADSKATPSGPESYYNHSVYYNGYSYMGQGVGNPFIVAAKDARKDLPTFYKDYFTDDRVIALYLAVDMKYDQWNFIPKFSVSRNYGDYHTSDIPFFWFARKKVPRTPSPFVFPVVNQFSAYIEASRDLKKNYSIGFVLAADYGNLLYNSVGGMIKLTKNW